MIVANLKGGLGNQLFQIAAGYAVAQRNGTEFCINYNLNHNCIQGHTPLKYKDSLYKNIPTTDYVPSKVYSEPFFHFKDLPKEKDILIDGYFQSIKYFEDYKLDIKNLFILDSKNLHESYNVVEEKTNFNKKLGVHIRRGDYKQYSNIHTLIPSNYYIEAISKLHTNQSIVAASDDWQSVYDENILGSNEYFSTMGCNELEDLHILSQCDDLIIGNSSFAWWCAFLGKEKHNVIAPDKWFGPGGPQDYEDIYCDNWIKLCF
jgi:hypothetical protein